MKRVRAVRFQKELPEGGRSKPLLLEAIDDLDEHVDLVVKLASQAATLDARRLVREAVATALAQKLELPVPVAFSTELTEAFITSVEASDRHVGLRLREHVRLAGHLAFGSTYMVGFEVVTPKMALSDQLKPVAAEIFAFDALTLNRDRCIPSVGNPNCLTNGYQFAMIDHEQSLDGEVLGFGDAQAPWHFNALDSMCGLLEHLFMHGLRSSNSSFTRLENAWAAISADERDHFFSGIPLDWDPELSERSSILEYLVELGVHLPEAFAEVRRVLA